MLAIFIRVVVHREMEAFFFDDIGVHCGNRQKEVSEDGKRKEDIRDGLTAWFLSIAYFSFFLMISAVLSWLGLKGLPVFVIILFFGAPLLSMAPELMSTFYNNWIYSWLPMRFMVDGLRELFFFDKGLSWNHPTAVLVGIGIGSLTVLLASGLKPGTKKEAESQTSM